MSTLFVDTINEKTSGNGIYIPGHVLQVVSANVTTTLTSNSNSWVEYLSANITPLSSSSKILISHSVSYGGADNSYAAGRATRTVSSTETTLRYGSNTYTENRFTDASFGLQMNASANDTYKIWNTKFEYLDSPSTTSQCTYKFYCKADAGNRNAHINKSNSNPGDGYNPPPWTSVMLLEVGG